MRECCVILICRLHMNLLWFVTSLLRGHFTSGSFLSIVRNVCLVVNVSYQGSVNVSYQGSVNVSYRCTIQVWCEVALMMLFLVWSYDSCCKHQYVTNVRLYILLIKSFYGRYLLLILSLLVMILILVLGRD